METQREFSFYYHTGQWLRWNLVVSLANMRWEFSNRSFVLAALVSKRFVLWMSFLSIHNFFKQWIDMGKNILLLLCPTLDRTTGNKGEEQTPYNLWQFSLSLVIQRVSFVEDGAKTLASVPVPCLNSSLKTINFWLCKSPLCFQMGRGSSCRYCARGRACLWYLAPALAVCQVVGVAMACVVLCSQLKELL